MAKDNRAWCELVEGFSSIEEYKAGEGGRDGDNDEEENLVEQISV